MWKYTIYIISSTMKRETVFKLSREFLELRADVFTEKQIQTLWELITFHSDLYYQKENPIISDSEYDELFKKLEQWELKFGKINQISSLVGSTIGQSSFQKVAHSRPMISLDNTYNEEDLYDFDARLQRMIDSRDNISYMIEFKFDGLWIELIYENWELIQAVTRWNGTHGEDVTQNIMQISNIPKKINKLWHFEVRGEVVMPISSFNRLNEQAKEQGEKIFSNPRNAASGSLRVLDTSITKKRDLMYFAYDVSDTWEFSTGTYREMIEYLVSLWFDVSSYFEYGGNITEVISCIETIWNIKQHIDFEIDGLVIKMNTMSLWNKAGFTQHHPRYAIAYKFPAEIVTTKLLSIEHSIGRTGSITPVANLEAVNIGGAIIRRATLHNYDEVEKLWVRIGDSVFLKRAGEVIPKIISVAISGNWESILPPISCPSCNTKILKESDKVRYYCPNSYGCPAQMHEKIAFAVGKHGFDIDGFWERQAELFYSLWLIKHIGDIFRLTRHRESMLELEWFKEKSVDKLLSWIEKKRTLDIVTFLKALWIPGVGKKTAKTLSELFTSHHDICYAALPAKDIIEQLPDIGPEVADSLRNFFMNQEIEIRDILEQLIIIFPEKKIVYWKYSWKKMCITGSFEWYSRDQLIEILEQQGWAFIGSVSVKTDYLLAWDKAGWKLKKARELSVEVLSLEEFLK